MATVFLVCAAAGGTILVLQLLLALVGLGGHSFDVDVPHDFSGDFHVDHPGDVDQAEHGGSHGATSLFRILSFRAVVAALTFFGLTGLATQSAGAPTPVVLVVAIAAGIVAMFIVYWMMQGLRELRADGTVRIQGAVGQHGNVYLRIPANRSGGGKIQISLQDRTMEYQAVTSGPELPTGAKIVVVGIVNPTTLDVQAEPL